jgi:hypothetical protein
VAGRGLGRHLLRLRGVTGGANTCSHTLPPVDKHELERLRRSIVMITPGQLALRREEAMALLEDLARVQERLDTLRTELRRLAEG